MSFCFWTAVLVLALNEAGCRNEKTANGESGGSAKSEGNVSAAPRQMVTAAIPVPPSYFGRVKADGSRMTLAEIFSEVTGAEMIPGAVAKFLPQQSLMLVHHYPEAVENFRQYTEGAGLYLPYEEAFREYTRLGVMIRCLKLKIDPETHRSGKSDWASIRDSGQVLDLSPDDLDYELVDEEIQFKDAADQYSANGLMNVRLSGRIMDPDFFSDSCFINVSYPVPDEPGMKLESTAHFVPGKEQLFYIGSTYVAGVTVFLISDFPIPTRSEWEKKSGARLGDYDQANMAFSFEIGRIDRFLPGWNGFDESKSWDFFYEPNWVGLGAFHPDVAIYANRKPDQTYAKDQPKGNGTSEQGDRGGICDLGDVPLETATVPNEAQFLPAIPKPHQGRTYAIRNRRGDLVGFIRIISVNSSKGDASFICFHWRRAAHP